VTRSGEPKFSYSRFSQDALVRTALQGSCTPEGCSVSASQDADGEARKRGKATQAVTSPYTSPYTMLSRVADPRVDRTRERPAGPQP
jgi:hypothetical protein